MHKKHIFLRVFSKITIFACVFCTISAWADTTTCDIDFTPVTGNSWQNGTPTPTNPVAIESIGTKVGNKYAVQVAVNYDGGVVDLGTLNWRRAAGDNGLWDFLAPVIDLKEQEGTGPHMSRLEGIYVASDKYMLSARQYAYGGNFALENDHYIKSASASDGNMWFHIRNDSFTDANEFKQSLSGVMLYYQRATDETWTAPTLRTIYLDEPLRKVGDYADVLDYKNGTITRNVGVKVLDGTENYSKSSDDRYAQNPYFLVAVNNGLKINNTNTKLYSNMFVSGNISYGTRGYVQIVYNSSALLLQPSNGILNVADFKSWLAEQYAAGTPVTVYYPLATPVVEQIENWSCIPPITEIKIATTKMVDDEFAATEAKLATTVQTIESVVSRTIVQTGQIATLQEEKQTRPDENCPANMKCLLVQDEDGTPHWYPIIEP